MSQFWFVKIKQALQFDGLDDYVSIPKSTSLDITTALTLLCWVKRKAFTETKQLIDKLVWADYAGYAYAIVADGRLRLYIGEGSAIRTITSTFTVPEDRWAFVAAIIDGSNAHLFLDDTKETFSLPYLPIVSKQDLVLGSPWGGSTSNVFEGLMTEYRIWNRALSSKEIYFLWNNGKGRQNPPEEGLVLDIDLNRWRGIDKVKDLSPYKNHGTIVGPIRVRDDR